MARLRAGERAAVTILYNNYSAVLYGTILRMVRCQATAEDALQETFLKAWASFASYNSARGRLCTWLLNIARHTAVDALRTQHYRRGALTQGIDESGPWERHAAHSPFDSDRLDVGILMGALRPEQKQVIDLLYFGGYSHTEVAEELGIPLGTVKTRARSGMQALRRLFAPRSAPAHRSSAGARR